MSISARYRWHKACGVILLICAGWSSHDESIGQVLSPLLRPTPQSVIKQTMSPLEPPSVLPQGQVALPSNGLLEPANIAAIASEHTINPTVLAPSARKALPRGFIFVAPIVNMTGMRGQNADARVLHAPLRATRNSTRLRLSRAYEKGAAKRHADVLHHKGKG